MNVLRCSLDALGVKSVPRDGGVPLFGNVPLSPELNASSTRMSALGRTLPTSLPVFC